MTNTWNDRIAREWEYVKALEAAWLRARSRRAAKHDTWQKARVRVIALLQYSIAEKRKALTMTNTIRCNEGGPYPWDYPDLVTDRNPACLCGHAQFRHVCDGPGEWNECPDRCACREFRDAEFGGDDNFCDACGEELCEGQTCDAGLGGPAEYERWCANKACSNYETTPRDAVRYRDAASRFYRA